jgi:hypothetical protein
MECISKGSRFGSLGDAIMGNARYHYSLIEIMPPPEGWIYRPAPKPHAD